MSANSLLLIVWGIAWNVAGAGLVYLIHKTMMKDAENQDTVITQPSQAEGKAKAAA